VAFAVRYVNLRDWQGGLLLRCPAEAELSRVAICAARCSVVVFDCAFSLARPVFRACYGLRLEPAAVETARCGGTNRTGRHLRREKPHGSARLWACGCRNNSIRMPISPPQHCRGNRRRGKLHPTGGEPHTRREKQRRPRDTFAARAGDTTPTRRIGTPARQLRPSACGHGRPATVAAPSQLTSRFRMPRHPLTRR